MYMYVIFYTNKILQNFEIGIMQAIPHCSYIVFFFFFPKKKDDSLLAIGINVTKEQDKN